jgi:hypothetical protein
MHIPPLRKEDRTWARSNKEKAKVFAGHLERTFRTHEEKSVDNLSTIAETQTQQIPPTTPKEILATIKANISPKKAPVFDLITGEILEQLPKQAIVKLTHLYNATLRLLLVVVRTRSQGSRCTTAIRLIVHTVF